MNVMNEYMRFFMTDWLDMKDAPRDKPILVKYDHDADPYVDPEDPHKLTNYAANAESGYFADGKGILVAYYVPKYFEAENEYGDGYWVPECWVTFNWSNHTEIAVNAIGWLPLPDYD